MCRRSDYHFRCGPLCRSGPVIGTFSIPRCPLHRLRFLFCHRQSLSRLRWGGCMQPCSYSLSLGVCVRSTHNATRTRVVAPSLSHCPWRGLLLIFVAPPLTSPLATAGCSLVCPTGRAVSLLPDELRQAKCRTVQRTQGCCELIAYGGPKGATTRAEACSDTQTTTLQ